jgi:osmotically-inducible protein OsmY
MQKETRWISFVGVGALALVFAAGCTGGDQTGDGQTADSPEAAKIQKNVDTAQNAAANAASAAGNTVANSAAKAGQTVVNGAAKAGQATANAAHNTVAGAKNLDDAATVTPTVKTALGANAALAGSNINVSTTDKNVTLEGTVKNAAQKTLAVQIAKKNAPGYIVVDKLKMG